MLQELYEQVNLPSVLPVKFFINRYGHVPPHWHPSLELILVLEGTVDIQVDGQSYQLHSEDIILINTNATHNLDSASAVSIAVQFSPEVFNLTQDEPDTVYFNCNSAIDPQPQRYHTLRTIIAQLVYNNANTSASTPYRNSSLYLYLISELMTYFRCSVSESIKAKHKHAARMTSILEYIEQHYRENFSLADLAESQQLSIPYLSSFFSKQMGVGFLQYYTNVKLDHAAYALMTTQQPIETIASDNGFPEPHAFVRAFKKKYGMLPSAYRREHAQQFIANGSTGQTNYLELEPSNCLHLLERYLQDSRDVPPIPSSPVERLTVPKVHTDTVLRQLRHTFRHLTTVGRAEDLLHQDILNMLKDMQSIVGFRYIRFHGLLSDEMMIVSRDRSGELHFNFSLVDQVVENILHLQLKPWIELSFMPSILASDKNKNIFQLPVNTSPPAVMDEWLALIDQLVRHLISRFGMAEVLSWPFSVWNEPDTPASMFGWENPEEFFSFYRQTRQAVKAIHSDICFGSPSTLYLRHNGESTWLRHFFSYVNSHHCRPDFLCIHYYADMLPSSNFEGMAHTVPSSRFPEDPNDYHRFITDYQALVSSYGLGDLPIYLTEWNLTLSHRNLINDTCFKSCYFAKNLLENYDRLECFGYWSLTDLLRENPIPDQLFHGGMGIYTMNGIRKPIFFALRFMGLLGDALLAQGNGYFITRKGKAIQVLTYHYVHYGSLFAAGEAFNITQADRYGIFDTTKKLAVTVPLEELTEESYLLKEYFINRDNGSAFDDWVKTGALPITGAEARIMNGACAPGFHQQVVSPKNGCFTYETTLEPLEVRLANFIPF